MPLLSLQTNPRTSITYQHESQITATEINVHCTQDGNGSQSEAWGGAVMVVYMPINEHVESQHRLTSQSKC